MYVTVTLVVVAVASCSAAASSTRPDLNPALGAYQDERQCFPFKSTLHQIYRNFESDPYLGEEAKCVRTGSTGPLVDSSLNTTFEYGSDGVLDVTITVMSSPGYTAANVLNLQPTNNDLPAFNFTVAYRDCKNCKVFRHSYIDNGAGCSYWVTDEALGEKTTCCEFVYELLCGTDQKYTIYDESCK
ncbi:uncharacterized protein LOC119443922 [Dermacentor silvarum]|uniref:uncharacterized protein LOC119443922 n=1 Tax=Dermacentor silvarum TaxID=543639 RepID=UPI0021008A05|nr:uncharacterized protein LOC119443922 [Dermacentor silvarum]